MFSLITFSIIVKLNTDHSSYTPDLIPMSHLFLPRFKTQSPKNRTNVQGNLVSAA